MSRMSKCALRKGVTLLEVLVVVSIVGLLAALSLSAIQSARNSSRRMACANHLQQIGVAMHSRLEVHGTFPSSNWSQELMPFLEQEALAEKVSSTHYAFADVVQVAESPDFHGGSMPVYNCPADPVVGIAPGRLISFQLNMGTSFTESDGMLKMGEHLSANDITDGLSTTVAVAEKLIYRGAQQAELPGRGPFTPNADQRIRRLAATDPFTGPNWKTQFADACASSPTWFLGSNTGVISTWAGPSAYGYNHILPPNGHSCFNGPNNADEVAMTATSLHGGGVNALSVDGSVHFVSESIDRQVWWALGTRNGGEAVSGGGF